MASNSNNSSSVFTCYKAKYNNISKQNKEYYSYIFLISLTLSLPECLMEFCKVTLTFESADETLWCDHSNETSLPVLTHGATCFSKFHKMKFGIFCRILPLATFGSERVNTLLISHYLVAPSLCFKARLSTKPLSWKWFFIPMQMELIITGKNLHLASFWKWGFF